MFRFIELIVRFKEYVILAALIVMSIALMSFGNAAKLGGFRTIIIGTIGVLQSVVASVPNLLTITSENAALRDLTYRLNQELINTRKSITENQRFRELLAVKDSVEYPVVTSKIVGRTMDKTRYYLTINAGKKDSIQESMAVVNYRGLVGYVFSTSDHYAIVQTILDRNTRIASRVERTRVSGIVAWDGGDGLWLKNVPKTDTVVVGDIVVTSSYSSRYPSDIIIGRVMEVRDEPNTLFSKIRLEAAVQFPTIEYVLVRRQQPDPERLMIEEMLEKKMQKK